ncbi:hypothetical protein NHX12_008509 [Muraenolepis orangiensis]|uniref:Uncharacterized protein n=1 Tax=Muraenolepis orangiensis TaxID=630683 RepID=A0A9Q0I9E2_9TELE|nr:hypothetical protein NHX12_008509 [Muraenolepis orangiensis]
MLFGTLVFLDQRGHQRGTFDTRDLRYAGPSIRGTFDTRDLRYAGPSIRGTFDTRDLRYATPQSYAFQMDMQLTMLVSTDDLCQ